MTDVRKTHRRIYAISDIHGDIHGLGDIFWHLIEDGWDPRVDLLVQTGDMVDGYNYSKDVVEAMKELQEKHPQNVVVLLGNHEEFVLRAIGKGWEQSDFRAWYTQGGEATYRSYNDGAVIKEGEKFYPKGAFLAHIEWFSTLPLYHETEDFIFVHAGLRPLLPLQAQKARDLLWIRDEFHNSSYDWGKTVVYGHTARENPLIENNKIGLDCRWRGRGCVSGARLDGGKIVALFEGRRD